MKVLEDTHARQAIESSAAMRMADAARTAGALHVARLPGRSALTSSGHPAGDDSPQRSGDSPRNRKTPDQQDGNAEVPKAIEGLTAPRSKHGRAGSDEMFAGHHREAGDVRSR